MRMKATDRALAALKKHGKLVRDRHWWGNWRLPIDRGAVVCGTVTVNRLLDEGKVELRGMEAVVLKDVDDTTRQE